MFQLTTDISIPLYQETITNYLHIFVKESVSWVIILSIPALSYLKGFCNLHLKCKDKNVFMFAKSFCLHRKCGSFYSLLYHILWKMSYYPFCQQVCIFATIRDIICKFNTTKRLVMEHLNIFKHLTMFNLII